MGLLGRTPSAACPLVLLVCACVGQAVAPGEASLGGGPSTKNPANEHTPVSVSQPFTCVPRAGPSPGKAPLRRLTIFEYNNTVADLLGDTTRPGDRFPAEERGNGFGNDADSQNVSASLIQEYFAASTGLVLRARAAGKLDLTGCDVAARGETTCLNLFLTSFGEKAFRRPLEPDELGSFASLFQQLRALPNETYISALDKVAAAILQSPPFLYKIETSTGQPTSAEMATRLSYLFWGSTPDEALLKAGREDRLRTAGEITQEAKRLLQSPKARGMVGHFFDRLFGLGAIGSVVKVPADFPAFTPELPGLLQAESRQFVEEVMWSGEGTLAALLSAPYSYLNETLARHYGVSGVSGTQLRKVALDPAMRAGLFTQGGPLAMLTPGRFTNPVIRGAFVQRTLLCNSPPDPPSNLVIKEPEFEAGMTTRERFERHRSDPACAGCHKMLDVVGFGLEHYDALGQWRREDNGKPVDARGELVASDVDGPFEGAPGLMQKLATSQQVRRCFAQRWFSFAHGRAPTVADGCSLKKLQDAFAGDNLLSLVEALSQTEAFLYRP